MCAVLSCASHRVDLFSFFIERHYKVFGRSLLKTYSGFVNVFSRFSDPLVIIIAAIVAYKVRFGFLAIPAEKEYFLLIAFAAFAVVVIFPLFNLYSSWRGQQLIRQVNTIIVAWFCVIVFFIVVLFWLKISHIYSRLWLSLWAVNGLLLLLALRMFIYFLLQYSRKHGFNVRTVVIAGAGDLGKKIYDHVKKSSWTGYKVVAFFDDDAQLLNTDIDGIAIKGNMDALHVYMEKNKIDEVWIALPFRAEERMRSLLYNLRHFTVNVKMIPDIFGLSLLNHSMTEIAGLPAVNLSDTPMGGINLIVKALEDMILGSIIIFMILPLVIVIALVIRLTSSGPVLFKQRRHGWDGKVINVYKFRTMDVQDGQDDNVIQAQKNDPRVTKFGAFLRRTSLDELPQFYNVLQGRMSIVGPRPHAVQHNELYKDQVDKYMLRHMVKPGITGWAQVNGFRGEIDSLDKIKKRIEYDLYYIENWSLWFDLKIIFMTVAKGFVNKNAY